VNFYFLLSVGALVIQVREEDLAASRNASRPQLGVTEGTSRGIADYHDSAASSCASLSTSSRLCNNNEMEMKTLATPMAMAADYRPPTASSHQSEQSSVDQDQLNDNRATPTNSDWWGSSHPSGTTSPTVDTDFTSDSSRPQTASSDQKFSAGEPPKASEIDNNNWAVPTVTFHDVPTRGSWKQNRKALPQVAHNDKSAGDGYDTMENYDDVKYERLGMKGVYETSDSRIPEPVCQDQDEGQIFVPVQSSDDSDEEYHSTHF
jgi:hypothetical protein